MQNSQCLCCGESYPLDYNWVKVISIQDQTRDLELEICSSCYREGESYLYVEKRVTDSRGVTRSVSYIEVDSQDPTNSSDDSEVSEGEGTEPVAEPDGTHRSLLSDVKCPDPCSVFLLATAIAINSPILVLWWLGGLYPTK